MTEEVSADVENPFADDPDVQLATIGIDLQKLMGQKAGKYLQAKSEQQIDEGISRLLELDPEDDLKEFRKVKTDILVAQQALTWINDAILEGEAAHEKILEEENDPLNGYKNPH